ncbi:RecT family [Aeromonas hydrophila]|nr:RecT family [Aeromonas hydrophila]
MNNQVATQETSPVLANERGQANMLNLMMNADFMASIDKMATMMASGMATVPSHLRGNQPDCFAICLQAIQWGMNPFPVAQKTHLVKGVLGYEAQLVNAVVVNSGAIKGRFDYEFFGPWEQVIGKFKVNRKEKDGESIEYRIPNWSFSDEKDCGVRVTATLSSGCVRAVTLLLQQARTRNSTLWADDPKQQLAYLGVKRWARLYTPDVILGSTQSMSWKRSISRLQVTARKVALTSKQSSRRRPRRGAPSNKMPTLSKARLKWSPRKVSQ